MLLFCSAIQILLRLPRFLLPDTMSFRLLHPTFLLKAPFYLLSHSFTCSRLCIRVKRAYIQSARFPLKCSIEYMRILNFNTAPLDFSFFWIHYRHFKVPRRVSFINISVSFEYSWLRPIWFLLVRSPGCFLPFVLNLFPTSLPAVIGLCRSVLPVH